MKTNRSFIAGAVLLAAAAGPAAAGTQQTTFLVTANVNAACTIAATDMVFGDYDPAATGDLDTQSQVQVNCTKSAEWNVGLNQGNGSGATTLTRKMTGPGTFVLNYSLTSDRLRRHNWGDLVGVDTVSGTGTGGDQIVTVYGRLLAGQDVGPGGYQDTIIATVTF